MNILFWLVSMKFFMEDQETMIYRLVTRSPGYSAYLPIFINWAAYGQKMGVVSTRATPVWGLKIQSKSWLTGLIFGAICYETFKGRTHLFSSHKNGNFHMSILLNELNTC